MIASVRRAIWAVAILLISVIALPGIGSGHALQPGYLEIRSDGGERYQVFWKIPGVKGRPMAIAARLPNRCEPSYPGPTAWNEIAFVAHWSAACRGGIEGGEIRIEGLENTQTDVLVLVELAGGTVETHRLTPEGPSFIVATVASRFDVMGAYFMLGVEHILAGFDHLLFVLALTIIVRGWRKLIETITAFTLAHSLTLAAATFGIIDLPGAPVEAVIALSIMFVAGEIVHGRRGRSGLTETYPWIVAFAFGLLHGLGFAGALGEIGLPEHAIPLALLFFNLGVEAGQLLFIAAVLPVMAMINAVARRFPVLHTPWAAATPSYLIGSAAAFWVIERVAAF